MENIYIIGERIGGLHNINAQLTFTFTAIHKLELISLPISGSLMFENFGDKILIEIITFFT